MSEQPPPSPAPMTSTDASASVGQDYDERIRAAGKSVTQRLVREHPTLILTLIYLALTFVGMIHDLWFYLYFRVNILDFSETSDFLLAAIRNPLVILLSMAPVGLLLGFARIRREALKRSPRYRTYSARYLNSRWARPAYLMPTYGFFILVYAILFTQLYAQAVSNRIKAGQGRRVDFVRTVGNNPAERPILLGSTSRFFLLYFPVRKVTEVVPLENTGMLSVDSRSRRQRRRDAAASALKR